MMRRSTVQFPSGTSHELIDAAGLGARIATRCFRAEGLDDETIRRKILTRFSHICERELYDDYKCEVLMVEVWRACEEVLEETSD